MISEFTLHCGSLHRVFRYIVVVYSGNNVEVSRLILVARYSVKLLTTYFFRIEQHTTIRIRRTRAPKTAPRIIANLFFLSSSSDEKENEKRKKSKMKRLVNQRTPNNESNK